MANGCRRMALWLVRRLDLVEHRFVPVVQIGVNATATGNERKGPSEPLSLVNPRYLALSLDGILDAANGVLDLALGLIHCALTFQLLVAGRLASHLLDLSAHVGGGALHPIFV